MENTTNRIHIIEGHRGGYFQIFPVRHTAVTEENWNGIEECIEEEISIDEEEVFYHLYYFLNKYFDKDYPYADARPPYCEDEFEWSMEYNIYTYETIKKMLSEIEECAHLLRTDFHNPKLDALKNKVCDHPFAPENIPGDQQIPAKKQELIAAVSDFYERFVNRMQHMMENASEYELISFMGP